MKKILITEFMEQESVDIISDAFDVIYDPTLHENLESLSSQIAAVDAVIVRNKTQLTEALLLKAKNLTFVGRLGVGLDNIDTEFCSNNNIFVQPATGMNADSVAEYVIACSLSLLKNIPISHNGTVSGQWPRTSIKSRELGGKTLGLLGFGVIGKKVSRLAQVFGANVIAYDPFVSLSDADSLGVTLTTQDELFRLSDVISIHLPLTDETRDLMNLSSFNKMKKSPIVINSSRGSIVNEEDLLKAYNENLINGFALDVYNSEPIKEKLYKEITSSMNCILTPHTSGVTAESNVRVSQFIADKVINFLAD
jgi:phosphoglycerate dehydrogenase-like enzyme|tara:strand:+ start:313 stop:1239 length:927 start_codon:yes stop_codon:yes gene_type:complete